MRHKNKRHEMIIDVISSSIIRNQEELLQSLIKKGFDLTQATLSRDLKQMKVAKQVTENGEYIYVLPTNSITSDTNENYNNTENRFLTIDFSGNLAVIKTRPGYAGSIASDIDEQRSPQILGSIAGDDTVLLIVKEGVTNEEITTLLKSRL